MHSLNTSDTITLDFVDTEGACAHQDLQPVRDFEQQINLLNDERRHLWQLRDEAIKEAYPNPVEPNRKLSQRLRVIERELRTLEDGRRRAFAH